VVRFALAGDDKHAGTASSPNAGLSRAEFLLESRSGESFAEISPDGRYLAYQSDESGRNEVYVRPYPIVDDRSWRISTDGGARAAWARDGSELFYIDASGALTSVAVQTSGPTFVAGKPVVVFDTKYGQPNPARHYDVSADGSRFLMLKESAAGDPNAAPASMVVVERWFDDLRQRVPPRRTVSRR
jgi:serine/threonine-protein kinase